MQRVGYRSRLARVGLCMALAALTAACTPDGRLTPFSPRATITFDSIDGPPLGIFNKLVQNLNAEAEARRLAVVSRADPSRYRVRGYMAAHVSAGHASIAWVWDIYDANQRHALRISGQEAGGKAGRDAWAAADDEMLQRIARDGMDQLAAFLDGPVQPQSPGQAALALAESRP